MLLLLCYYCFMFFIVIDRFFFCLSFTAYIFLCATSLNRSLSSAHQSDQHGVKFARVQLRRVGEYKNMIADGELI